MGRVVDAGARLADGADVALIVEDPEVALGLRGRERAEKRARAQNPEWSGMHGDVREHSTSPPPMKAELGRRRREAHAQEPGQRCWINLAQRIGRTRVVRPAKAPKNAPCREAAREARISRSRHSGARA